MNDQAPPRSLVSGPRVCWTVQTPAVWWQSSNPVASWLFAVIPTPRRDKAISARAAADICLVYTILSGYYIPFAELGLDGSG